MLRLFLAAATLALLTLPAGAADPAPDVCPNGPCVREGAEAGPEGVDAYVVEQVDDSGAGVFVHAGTDGTADVTVGVGITRCSTGMEENGGIYVFECVF